MYPKSALGYVVGATCALTGILATGLPVPIIANNFNLYYSRAQQMEEILKRKNIVTARDAASSMGSLSGSEDHHVGKHRKPLMILEASV